jgi:GWxTD domain-containing protein
VRLRPGLAALAALLLCVAPVPGARAGPSIPSASDSTSTAARAERLRRAAADHLARGGVERRRIALFELEQAVQLEPDDPRLQLTLARACFDAGFNQRARDGFQRAAELDPDDAAAELGLGRAWKYEWLATVDTAALTRAVVHLSAATRLDPANGEAWTLLAPLLYERGRLAEARDAAASACAAPGDHPLAPLAAAYMDYRGGRAARAESLFAAALPRLPRDFAARFADLSPLLPPDEAEALAAMDGPARAELERRFWSRTDPDPTTPENEARLEYWSRVAHAGLLFLDDPAHMPWDLRTDLYVRYGAPRGVAYEPPGLPLFYQFGKYGLYPLHSQLWDYSHLGMLVPMYDFLLTNEYRPTRTRASSADPVPDAGTLARADLVATDGGRALFRTLPPGVRSLAIAGQLARFESERGARLVALVEAPGTPADSLWAQCALLDSSERVIARAVATLSPSGCEPATRRAGEFTFDVPPGPYRVALSVRDGGGARGVARVSRDVAPSPAGLAISDLVVTCGPLDAMRGATEVRLGPNLAARVGDDGPLVAYFETYRLRPGPDGLSRVRYEYSVEPATQPARPWLQRLLSLGWSAPLYFARREETQAGPLRRQFISVPVQSLRPGPYRLQVRVRDLVTGDVVTAATRFERVRGPAAGSRRP